jgi:hypothetical protein
VRSGEIKEVEVGVDEDGMIWLEAELVKRTVATLIRVWLAK